VLSLKGIQDLVDDWETGMSTAMLEGSLNGTL
jgi:hypothetical protein